MSAQKTSNLLQHDDVLIHYRIGRKQWEQIVDLFQYSYPEMEADSSVRMFLAIKSRKMMCDHINKLAKLESESRWPHLEDLI